MNLLAFLASGGEAVVRGVLSTFPGGRLLSGGSLTPAAFSFLESAMHRKFPTMGGVTPSWLRSLGNTVAEAMGSGSRFNPANPNSRVRVTARHPEAAAGDTRVIYTVIVRTHDGSGHEVETLAEVVAGRPLTNGEIIAAAQRISEDRITRGQVTVGGSSRGDYVTEYRVVSAYIGGP